MKTENYDTHDAIIHETKNYDLFDVYEVNRDVKRTSKSFKRLLESIKTHGFISAYPLHCIANGSGKLKIKAGHNRFEAARTLGMPIKYVVSDDDASVHSLEIAGPGKWNLKDFLVSYCKKGLKNYLYLQEYIDRTGIGVTDAASMFYGNAAGSHNFNTYGKFSKGWFEIKNFDHPKIVGDIVVFLNSLGIKWANNGLFVKALSRTVFVKEFDPFIFKEKAKQYPFLLTKQRNIDNYAKMIETVYNYKTPKSQRLNISFLADQKATERGTLNKPN